MVGVSANSGGVDDGAKTHDEPSPEFSGSKPEPKSKKRKLDDEISLPNSESEFTLDGDGADDRHDAQAKATNEWLVSICRVLLPLMIRTMRRFSPHMGERISLWKKLTSQMRVKEKNFPRKWRA